MDVIMEFLSGIGLWFQGLIEAVTPWFQQLIDRIAPWVLGFLSQYSFLLRFEYYEVLFEQYFSVSGFILGFIFLLMLYFSRLGDDEPDASKASFFKIVPIIAVITSCAVLPQYLRMLFDHTTYYTGETHPLLFGPDNIISGCILTLAVYSCYREYYHRQAFLFGLATYVAVPLLNFTGFEENPDIWLVLIIRMLMAGFLCLIISHREHFYTAWIWYFGFHMFLRTLDFFNPTIKALITRMSGPVITLDSVLTYYSGFILDGIIFVVILVMAILFDKFVLEN